jgi:anthranilate synthase component 1
VAHYYPSLQEFERLTSQGARVPVFRRLLDDALTPVSAFRKLADDAEHAFLLESAAGPENSARYSFLGSGPRLITTVHGYRLRIQDSEESREFDSQDPLGELDRLLGNAQAVKLDFLPSFTGGLVGYAGYDVARYFEPLPSPPPDTLGLPDLYFMLFDTLVIFDHYFKTIAVVSHASPEKEPAGQTYREACQRVDAAVERLRQPVKEPADDVYTGDLPAPSLDSNFTQEGFTEAVRRCKEYIVAGDILQVVLSQRLHTRTRARPFDRR